MNRSFIGVRSISNCILCSDYEYGVTGLHFTGSGSVDWGSFAVDVAGTGAGAKLTVSQGWSFG